MPVQDPTTNYNWNLPDVNGDDGVWGGLLRAIIGDDSTGIDAVLQDISDVADAAMPAAGGVFTGNVKVLTQTYTLVDLGDSQTGAQTINLSLGNFFRVEHSGAGTMTFTFSNPPASGDVEFFMLEIQGAGTVSWPASVSWPGGSAPSLGAGVDVFSFYTRDGGTNWVGVHGIQDAS